MISLISPKPENVVDKGQLLVKAAYDIVEFTKDNKDAVKMGVAHVYISALAWVGKESHMQKMTEFFPKRMIPCDILLSEKVKTQTYEQTTGHTDWVRSVGFSPDGKWIASGSDDSTVRLWDAQTGTQIGSPFTGHTDLVLSVAFSPDGSQVVSGYSDDSIRTSQLEDGPGNTNFSGIGSFVAWDDSGFLVHGQKGTTHAKPAAISEDGWIKDKHGNCVFWVPKHARAPLLEKASLCIGPSGVVKDGDISTLDISNFVCGDRWTDVYSGHGDVNLGGRA